MVESVSGFQVLCSGPSCKLEMLEACNSRMRKEVNFSLIPVLKIPYQTPEVLLSYVSKDASEGEEVLSNSCLTGDTGHRASGVAKMVTKACLARRFL